MKKILFVVPVIVLLAAGCTSSQQASVQAPVIQNMNSTSPASSLTPQQSPVVASTTAVTASGSSRIAVTSPTEGQTFLDGNKMLIKWTSVNVAQVKIQLYKSGNFYSNISPGNSINNQGAYSWVIPSTLSSDYDYQIVIIDPASGAVSQGPKYFTIASQADVIKGRDDARRADMQELNTSLQLYYDDYKTYPASLSALTPVYDSGALPVAPEPADGSCTERQNTYIYTLVTPQSYAVTFCLGIGSEIYGPGMHTLSPTGIK